MKKAFALIMAFCMIFSLYSCKSGPSQPSNASFDEENISLVFITEAKGDKLEKNIQIINAVEDISKYVNVRFKVTVPKSKDDYERDVKETFTSLSKIDFIIGASYPINELLMKYAPVYPDKKVVILGNESALNECLALVFKDEESSFLAGVLAAKKTKTGTIAYIGYNKSDNDAYEYGFLSGVYSVDKNIKVISKYVTSYNDSSGAFYITKKLIQNNNCDVIFASCAASAIGVKDAAKTYGANIIATDLYDVGRDDCVLANVCHDYYDMTSHLTKDVFWSSFEKVNLGVGLLYGAVDLDLKETVKDDIVEVISSYKTKITSSLIKVPKNKSEYEDFIK